MLDIVPASVNTPSPALLIASVPPVEPLRMEPLTRMSPGPEKVSVCVPLSAPLVTLFIGLVFTYFASQIIGNTFFVIDGLSRGVSTGNPKVFIGFVLYGLLSLLVLFIFIRFISQWFVFTRKTFLGFVMKVTNPIMIPVQKLIPPIGMFDISAMIVLILIGLLQSLVLRIFVFQ